jgi:hypothetical protein
MNPGRLYLVRVELTPAESPDTPNTVTVDLAVRAPSARVARRIGAADAVADTDGTIKNVEAYAATPNVGWPVEW